MNYAIDANDVALALRLLRNMPVGTLQIGYVINLPVDPVLELAGAPVHPLYAFGLAMAVIQAQARGATSRQPKHGAVRHSTPLKASTPTPLSSSRRSSPMRCPRRLVCDRRAATPQPTSNKALTSPATDHRVLAGLLGSAVMYRTMAGDNDAAERLATEGLALLASREGPLPSPSASPPSWAQSPMPIMNAPACCSVRRWNSKLDSTTKRGQNSRRPHALVSARLQDWDQALDLASRSIRHLHWFGNRPLLAAMLNIVARGLPPTNAEPAAIVQGAAHSFATTTTSSATAHPSPPSQTSFANRPQPSSAISFVTQLRRETTGLLESALGQQRLHELRAQGQAMNTDDAVAYTLAAITRASERAEETHDG